MSNSNRHFFAAAVCSFAALALIHTKATTSAVLLDYALAFVLVGGLHRALEQKK